MIDLYTSSTPNGWKVSMALEELGLDYEVHAIRLSTKAQKEPEYLKLNPNGRIPTIVDRDNDDFAVFESGAILLYLAEKTGQLLPSEPKARSTVVQWLMFQMGGIGPMMGQSNVFYRYAPVKLEYAIGRYHRECRRLFEVLDGRLADHEYLAGDYSIADIANYAWVHTYPWSGVSVDGLEHLQRWMYTIAERPAIARGRDVPSKLDFEAVDKERFIAETRDLLA